MSKTEGAPPPLDWQPQPSFIHGNCEVPQEKAGLVVFSDTPWGRLSIQPEGGAWTARCDGQPLVDDPVTRRAAWIAAKDHYQKLWLATTGPAL